MSDYFPARSSIVTPTRGRPRWRCGPRLRSRPDPRRGWLVLLGSLLLAAAPPARGADYGVFVEAETEEDLLELLRADEIDQDSYETLTELLNDGVDLNSASREELYTLPNLSYADVDAILAFRKENGEIRDPVELVSSGTLTKELLLSIAPFLVVSEPGEPATVSTRARIRYRTTFVAGDETVPPMMLAGNLSTLRHLDAGVIGVLTRNTLGEVRAEPNSFRDGLSAAPPGVKLQPAKYFAQWKDSHLHLVAGTYRIGFGQRLVFDNTGRYVPHGIRVDDTIYYSQDLSLACRESAGELTQSPCSGDLLYSYQAPDYRWTDRLRGFAAGYRTGDTFGQGFSVHAFGSWVSRGVYQYELFRPDRCDDPERDDDPACKAPPVYKRQDDPAAAAPTFKYVTLPDLADDLLAGGNFTYFFDRRTHLGVTGYGDVLRWKVEGMELDFQEYSRYPYGGPFGAVGLDAAWGAGNMDVALEVARSFDGTPTGGGFAGILRGTANWKKQEIEGVLRAYAGGYKNPYARPIAEPDEYGGLRSADELGLRLKYRAIIDDLRLNSMLDFWAPPSSWTPKMAARVRADYEVETWFRPGLWVEYQDKDLGPAEAGVDECFDYSSQTIAGEVSPCAGKKLKFGGQAAFLPRKSLSFVGRTELRLVSDPAVATRGEGFRKDLVAYLWVTVRPVESLRLRLRVRYLNEDLGVSESGEDSLWWFVEAAWGFEKTFRAKFRAELYTLLDDRDSTQQRQASFRLGGHPSDLWLRLELEYRF